MEKLDQRNLEPLSEAMSVSGPVQPVEQYSLLFACSAHAMGVRKAFYPISALSLEPSGPHQSVN